MSNEARPGQMVYGVECGGFRKTLQAEPGVKEFELVCDKCGHKQTYRSSDVSMRQLQI